MSIKKTMALLLGAGLFAVTLPVQGQVVLVEQNVNFQFKLTTMKPPVVDKTIMSFSAKMSTLSVTVTTKDILKTLGFDPSARVIARLLIITNVPRAYVTGQIVVKSGGSETDVTSTLGSLIPTNNPLSTLQQGVFASGVINGTAQASVLENSASAALKALTYEQIGVKLTNFQAGGVALGNFYFNAGGVTASTIVLKGSRTAINLTISTKTQVSAGAEVLNPPFFTGVQIVPAVIQGTITTTGSSHIEAADLPAFIYIGEPTGP